MHGRRWFFLLVGHFNRSLDWSALPLTPGPSPARGEGRHTFSRQYILYDLRRLDGQRHRPRAYLVRALRIDAGRAENRRRQVAGIHRSVGHLDAVVVGRSVDRAGPEARPGKHARPRRGVVVAADVTI